MTVETNPTDAAPASSSSWFLAVGVGAAAGVPVGWLLSNLALLPFYLGLFFFLLCGLLVGALMYRVAHAAAPIPRWAVILGAAVVAGMTWLTALGFESRHLGGDAARSLIASRQRLTPDEILELRDRVPANVAEHLRTNYPPGGTIGYVRWVATSGQMVVGVTDGGNPFKFSLRQRQLRWVFRAAMSVPLLFFGVMSQVVGLWRLPGTGEDAHDQPDDGASGMAELP